ncbi:hypothetical protein [Aquimarina rhabdastrellae]
MDLIEKHKALIITIMLMGIFILSLANIGLSKSIQQKKELLVEMSAESFVEEKAPEEEKESDPIEERKLIAAKRTHQAHNEDLKNFSDDAFEERYKALTEKISAGTKGQSEQLLTANDGASSSLNKNIEHDDTSKTQGLKNDAAPANTNADTRSSSITYTLKDRQADDLPNPVYTCEGSGKIVVRIKVNQYGYVTSTKVNSKKSTTKNQCLIDNALLYARKARFSDAEKDEQLGFITYYFNYQS